MNKFPTLLFSLLLIACSGPEDEAELAAEKAIPVTVGTPQIRDIDIYLSSLGSIESLQSPTITAETAGRITRIAVSEGDSVNQGQLLVEIDDTLHQIETAKAAAELNRQKAMVSNQSREVERLHRLAKTQSVSQDQLEDQQDQLTIMQGQLEVAQKQWEQAKYLASKTRVTAPISGQVSTRHISIGDYVTTGQALFAMVSTDTLRARLAFPEHQAPSIRLGQQVVLSSPASPDAKATGSVTSINPQIAMGNRALDVLAEFSNPGGWLPGSSVDAKLLVTTHQQAISVPLLSVGQRNQQDTVFIVVDGRASARSVTLGWREQDWVEVVSGLSAEDKVVIEGSSLIADGSLLNVRESQP